MRMPFRDVSLRSCSFVAVHLDVLGLKNKRNQPIPDAQCMVYLPTFTSKTTQI